MSQGYDDDMLDRIGSDKIADLTEVKLTPAEKELQDIHQRAQQHMADQTRQYMESLFRENETQPITVRNAQVTNSQSFRDGFLRAQLEPLLKSDEPQTLAQFLTSLDTASNRLIKHGILDNLLVLVNALPPSPFLRGKSTYVVPIFNILPSKRFYAKTGTNVGNGEGDGYIQFQLKNVFGGAENLVFDAVTGTKTPSLYLLNYNQPINANPDYILENLAYVNTRKYDWLASEVLTRGLTNKVFTRYGAGKVNHEFILENCWKVLSNQSSKADDVLTQAGPHFKSSIMYNASCDTRDSPHLPTRGYFWRIGAEYSGLIRRINPFPHFKAVAEGQLAIELPTKRIASHLIFTNKMGFLFPLSKRCTLVLERFYIGGPNDVRSFLLNGLGPKSFQSAIGGDAFLSGGVSLVSQIPFIAKDSNFKFHTFFNYGKLVAVDSTKISVKNLVLDFSKQFSASCGTGILYDHPMARFELNITMPLAIHANDAARKGIQYGIGASFL